MALYILYSNIKWLQNNAPIKLISQPKHFIKMLKSQVKFHVRTREQVKFSHSKIYELITCISGILYLRSEVVAKNFRELREEQLNYTLYTEEKNILNKLQKKAVNC